MSLTLSGPLQGNIASDARNAGMTYQDLDGYTPEVGEAGFIAILGKINAAATSTDESDGGALVSEYSDSSYNTIGWLYVKTSLTNIDFFSFSLDNDDTLYTAYIGTPPDVTGFATDPPELTNNSGSFAYTSLYDQASSAISDPNTDGDLLETLNKPGDPLDGHDIYYVWSNNFIQRLDCWEIFKIS